MKKYMRALTVLMPLMVMGCSTNRLGDLKKSQYIEHLSNQGEEIMEQIDQVLSEKERAALALKKQLLALQSRIKQKYGEHNIRMKQIKEGWQVTILDQILFNPGSDQVNSLGRKVLEKVADVVKTTHKKIQISGHTDNVPVQKSKYKYKNNWDLSVKRALSVVHLFEGKGVEPNKIFAVGFGEHRPISSNATEKGRHQNRRVEILILNELERINWAETPKRARKAKSKKSYIK